MNKPGPRGERLRRLFTRALVLDETALQALLDAEASDDRLLRQELKALIKAYCEARDFLEQDAGAFDGDILEEDPASTDDEKPLELALEPASSEAVSSPPDPVLVPETPTAQADADQPPPPAKKTKGSRFAIVLAILVPAALAGIIGQKVLQNRDLEKERDLARAQRLQEEQLFDTLIDSFQAADPSQTLPPTLSTEDFLQLATENLAATKGLSTPSRARLQTALATLHARMALYPQAQALLEKAVAALRSQEPPDGRALATVLDDLGALLVERDGDLETADNLLTEALELRRELDGEGSASDIEILTHLAILARAAKDPETAEERFRTVLRAQEPDDLVLVDALVGLAALLDGRGELAEAEELRRRILAIHQRAYGENHVAAAGSGFALARHYLRRGLYSKAEPLLWRALEVRKAAYGDDHPEVALTLGVLGQTIRQRGRLEGARPLLQQALDVRRRNLDDESPEVASSWLDLGVLERDAGNLPDAESALLEALRIDEATIGRSAPDSAQVVLQLGLLRLTEKKPEEAQALLQEALEIFEGAYGQDHPRRADCLLGLAQVALTLGDSATAIDRAREAGRIYEASLAKDSPPIHEARAVLGAATAADGRVDEGRLLLERAIERLRAHQGDQAPTTRRAAAWLEGLE